MLTYAKAISVRLVFGSSHADCIRPSRLSLLRV
jgi:hypothetical protein